MPSARRRYAAGAWAAATMAVLLGTGAAATIGGPESPGQLPQAEVDFLHQFYEDTNGAHWIQTDGWQDAYEAGWDASAVKPCPDENGHGGWPGIYCAGAGGPKPWHLSDIKMKAGDPGMDQGVGNNVTGWLPSFVAMGGATIKISISLGVAPACTFSGDPQNPVLPGNEGTAVCTKSGFGYISGTLPPMPPGRLLSLSISFADIYTLGVSSIYRRPITGVSPAPAAFQQMPRGVSPAPKSQTYCTEQ